MKKLHLKWKFQKIPTNVLGRAMAIFIAFITATLILFFSYAVQEYKVSLNDRTETVALQSVQGALAEYEAVLARRAEAVRLDLAGVAQAETVQEVGNYLAGVYSNAYEYVAIRYFQDGVERSYATSDGIFHEREDDTVLALAASGVDGWTGIVTNYDPIQNNRCLVYGMAIADNPHIDYVVAFMNVDRVFEDLLVYRDETFLLSEYSCLAADSGLVVTTLHENDDTLIGNNLFESLRDIAYSKSPVDSIESMVHSGKAGTALLDLQGVDYAIAVGPMTVEVGSLYIVEIFNPHVVFEADYAFTTRLGGTIVVLVFIFIGLVLMVFAMKSFYKRELYKADNLDPELGCYSFKKFLQDGEDFVNINRSVPYAVVYLDVANYEVVVEKFGAEVAKEVLVFVGSVLQQHIGPEETYGHMTGSKFAALLHYRTPEDLITRLRVFNAVIYNYKKTDEQLSLRISVGVYCLYKSEVEPVQRMLDKAVLAENTKTGKKGELFYNIYSETVSKRYERERRIEANMEDAMRKGEFKVFLQPKYSLASNHLDGAEALARWYQSDSKTYMQPNDFIPLFEANGFIIKLDRYVLTEVCKFMHETAERGGKVVPVSVNVSRVSALAPDFVDYYIKIKKQYRIPDHYIMVEITESVASENYEALKDIVKGLHAGGFDTSIDDFGSGFSSYAILKDLQMDELKLDRFFIAPGLNKDRDDALLRSIISLGKSFGMKVVQEGVETVEDVRRLREMGCSTIQGYYYSKPLILSSYSSFAETRMSAPGGVETID